MLLSIYVNLAKYDIVQPQRDKTCKVAQWYKFCDFSVQAWCSAVHLTKIGKIDYSKENKKFDLTTAVNGGFSETLELPKHHYD